MSIEMTPAERETHLRKIDAEIAKLLAETSKINAETRWYAAVIASSVTLAIVAVVKLFL